MLFIECFLESLIFDSGVQTPFVDTDRDRVFEVALTSGTNLFEDVGTVEIARNVKL